MQSYPRPHDRSPISRQQKAPTARTEKWGRPTSPDGPCYFIHTRISELGNRLK